MLSDNLLYRDKALNADILESLRRGTADVIYDGADGILIKERTCALYMMSAEYERGRELLSHITEPAAITLRGEGFVEYAAPLLGREYSSCWQVLYERPEPPNADTGEFEIRPLDAHDYETVKASYNLISEPELYHAVFESPFFAAYCDGKLAGYIGLHAEGSMGLLHVFPEYRRKKLGRALLSHMIAHQLSVGALPYGQVFDDNSASLELQRSLGMTFSLQKVYWFWNK